MVRTGMTTLIDTLRGLTDAGTAEWTVAGQAGSITYWDDDEIQRVLDRHREDIIHADLDPVESYSSGTVVYLEYRAGYGDIESGTAVFKIENVDGTIGGWSMDYARGVATFSTNQAGSAYYWTGRTYDLNAAAADVWRMKAANVAKMFDFSTDGHSIKRSALRQSYLDMAQYYASMSVHEGWHTTKLIRSDL